MRQYSNLGALSGATFSETLTEGLTSGHGAQRMFAEALTAAVAYAENPQGWLVLTGPSGSGKTHLAAAIANRCIERQQTTLFIMVADLLDHLRAAYSPSSETTYDELFEQVRNVPLLVLDDLGVHSATPWAQEKLFQVINHRHNNGLPTVVTIRGPLPRLDESLRTRLEAADGRSTILQLAPFNNRLASSIGELDIRNHGHMIFDNFDTRGAANSDAKNMESLRCALDAAKSYLDAPDDWLVFNGPNGSGKTHLAISIAWEFQGKGKQVLFAFVPDLLDHLRTTYSPDSTAGFDEVFDQVRNSDLLILDDLGSENSTPWAEEKLYQIIVHRQINLKDTIITTTSGEGEFNPRISSRLSDKSKVKWVTIAAPDYRPHPRKAF